MAHVPDGYEGFLDQGYLDVEDKLKECRFFLNLMKGTAGASAPEPSEKAVEIRARTGFGDITIRRSLETRAAAER